MGLLESGGGLGMRVLLVTIVSMVHDLIPIVRELFAGKDPVRRETTKFETSGLPYIDDRVPSDPDIRAELSRGRF